MYQLVLIDDGSTDNSLHLAQLALQKHPQLNIKIQAYPVNRGKVAVINQTVPTLEEGTILFFSDVSSSLSTNMLHRANQYFNLPSVGVFCPIFHLKKEALTGEKTYWSYQSAIKVKEAKLGTCIGYHGSGYAIRKSSWHRLEEKTINDDLVIPLQAISQGFVGVYDTESEAIENETSSEHLDWHRRIRIGAGNIQQIFLLSRLLKPRFGFIAWMFFSGKVIRTIMPWLLILVWLSNLYLANHGNSLFLCLWWAQNVVYLGVITNLFYKTRLTELISYFVIGHAASLCGLIYLFQLNKRKTWQRASQIRKKNYIHPVAFMGKWIIDKISALFGVLLFVLLIPFIAIGIKISSRGPIIYKQLRVGQTTDTHTKLFYIYKFRTMIIDSETKKNRWTGENDARVYPFGRFLRKTHLDELPQFLNILKGDMSLVGPRPERPSLFPYIIKHLPFYEDRLYWIKPGLTGLAQITYRYDKTIEDVKRKVAFDHAYAIYLTKPLMWLKTDFRILIKTVSLVFLGKGF